MFKSRPLFLVVVTLCLLMAVIVSYWVALMPQRGLRNLKADMLETSGLVLDAKRARLDIGNGFGVLLEDVTLSTSTTSTWQLSAKSMALPGLMGGNVVLDQAVLDVDVATVNAGALGIPNRITLRDGILKMRDPARQAVVAVTDINGEISAVGAKGLQGKLAMVWGSQVSDLVFGIDDLERFALTGSPMDLTLKSKAMLFGFSGQGRADNGFKLAGQATADATDIGSFFRWLGMSVQTLDGGGAVALQSGLETNGLAMTFGTLKGDVGGTELKGGVTVAAGADRPKLSGNLNVATLSLWGPKTDTSVLAQPWSEKPVPVSDFAAMDLDMTVTADQLKLRQRNWGAVTAQLKSSDGAMTMSMADQKMAGGMGQINVILAKAGAYLKMQAQLDIRSASAQTLLGGLLGLDVIDGAVNVTATLKANGQSMAGMVSTLEGPLKFSMQDAVLRKVDLLNAVSQPQKGWNPQDALRTEKMAFDFDTLLSEGVATLRSGLLRFNGVTLKPSGEIDTLRQAVAVQLAPSGKNTDANMLMSGTWLAPEFSAADSLKEKTAITPPAN